MNTLDHKIIFALQHNSAQPLQALADAVGLSPSACHRRIKILEERGIIEGYTARLNGKALGYEIEAFVEISLKEQTAVAMDRFERALLRQGDILEAYLTTGEADYTIRVVAQSVADFERIHRDVLSDLPGVASVKTSFALRTVKARQGYPVPA